MGVSPDGAGPSQAEPVVSALRAAVPNAYVVDWIGGKCPVQAEGTVDGMHFYFRARGDRWRFHVAPTDHDFFTDREVFYMEQDYGDGPFDAGWMGDDEALQFIEQAVKAFREVPSGIRPQETE